MAPLSEHEQKVLMDLEMSLLSDSRGHEALSPSAAHRRARRGIVYCSLAFVLGTVVLVASFTQSLAVAAVGLFVMIGSSLLATTKVQMMSRASKMLGPRGQSSH